MTVSVEEVLSLGRSPRLVETFFIAKKWNLMRLESNPNCNEVVGILAVQPEIPEIAASRRFKKLFVIGGTAQDIQVSQIIREHHIRRRVRVSGGQRAVIHIRKPVAIILNVELERDTDLVQVAQAASCPPSLFGATQCG